jgi:hypothetical protein
VAAFSIYNAGTQSAAYDTVANAFPQYSTFQRSIVAVGGVTIQRIEGGSKMYKKSVSAKVPFKAVDAGGLGVTGLSITAKTAKDGANPAAATNNVVESGQGWYYVTLTAGEMGGDIVVLDVSASGVSIAPITISTESDYTVARAANLDNLDAAISTRASPTNITAGTITTVTNLTNAPTAGDLTATMKASVTTAATAATPTVTTSDTSGTTTLLGRLTSTRAGLLDNLNATISSRAVPGDAMALTSGERTTLAASIWNALTSGMTTAGSIGKKLADWVIGTAQTGDSFARLGAPSGASISADIAAISVATNASGLATKEADSATLTTGTTISGSYASTATNDGTYWITAPVTPAVAGFGLRQQLVFDLPLGRTPVGVQVRGYFNGSGAVVDVYALNSRTGVYDKLTNTNTNLASRNSDSLYAIPLPRDYADDSGGSFNVVTLEFRSASTATAHRLRVDQALIAHVAEDVAVTSTAPTAEQIWSYVSRELTTPGADPVVVPSAADIRSEMDANSTKLAHLDADVSTRLAASGYTAPDNTDIAAIKAKTDLIPASPAAVGDIPSASTVAAAVRTNLTTELGRIDVAVSSVGGGSAPTAVEIADEVQTRTLNADIKKVNSISISGTGTAGNPWGP